MQHTCSSNVSGKCRLSIISLVLLNLVIQINGIILGKSHYDTHSSGSVVDLSSLRTSVPSETVKECIWTANLWRCQVITGLYDVLLNALFAFNGKPVKFTPRQYFQEFSFDVPWRSVHSLKEDCRSAVSYSDVKWRDELSRVWDDPSTVLLGLFVLWCS